MQVLEFTCALIFQLSQINEQTFTIHQSNRLKNKTKNLTWHEMWVPEREKDRLKKKGQFLKSCAKKGPCLCLKGHLNSLIRSGLFEMFNERMIVIGELIGCSSILLLVFSVSEKG